ncbi:MAG: M24 family metallopeptidase [Phycisphaeraceae bacterium]
MAKKRTSRSSARAPEHFRQRVKNLQQRLQDSPAGALLVTNPRDIRYLTGFLGDDSWALVRQNAGKVDILSDFRFEQEIQREAPHARAVIRKKGLVEELARLLDRTKIEKIGLQEDHVSVALRKKLVKQLGARRLAELDDGLLEQRSVKDEPELKLIRRALRIQEQAFEETLEFIEPGRTEQEVAAYLEYRMRVLGADGPSFHTIVAADASASLPHAVPGKKKIRKGSTVLIDWGARYQGYCSDLTRVVGVGAMKAKVRETYQIVLDAQQAAIDAVEPGRPLAEIDGVARDIIRKAGYGKQFGHSLGHGIGLDVHEQPTLSPRSEGELRPGQVVTVEPGIYLPGVGGVRIEDDVLVTEKGCRVLSRLPKGLESAMI